jgi:hypothetical protein
MIAAVHLENLLFLVFLAVAFFFQLLTKAASKARKGPGQARPRSTPPPLPVPPTPRAPMETDEERIRKFLEALGQPPTAKPPPPVAQRPTYQKPMTMPHLPPLTTRPPDIPREIRLPGQIPPAREARTFVPKVAEPAVFEVQRGPSALPAEPPALIKTAAEAYAIATQPVSTVEKTRTDLARLLGSASGLRDAIILREVFGAPRSMQPLELVRNI